MALHEQCVGATDEWYTPPYVFEAMSCSFDTDVASPGKDVTPWIPARSVITEDSLEKYLWVGFIWMNPPFGGRNGLVPWLEKFVRHANGVCLVPDRTSAPWWQQFVRLMDLTLFVDGKIKFIGATASLEDRQRKGHVFGASGRVALRRSPMQNRTALDICPKPQLYREGAIWRGGILQRV